MAPKAITQKRTLGDFVKIELGDGFHTYARVLGEATFAVYDCRSADDDLLENVESKPVLFQVAVLDSAVKEGRWQVVGNRPLEKCLQQPMPKFMQDRLRPESFSIYENGQIRPASRTECLGLERASVWDPAHVEERLRDHFAGRKNKWLESQKIRDPRTSGRST